jgi:serine/threonine protein kinase
MGAVLSNKSEPMMVMEYMYFGSLYDLLHNESMFLDLRLLVGMLQDIASGLRFLHSCSPAILHGDLKSHNILVDNKFRAKLSDFGCGRLRADKGVAHKSEGCRNPTTNSPHKTSLKALGTPFWMAPELLRGDTGNTMESDVYSFGIVMYEIFSRKEPYEEDEDYHKVLQQVACSKTNKRPRRPNDCPAEAERIMNACLNSDPQLRPTAVGLDICMRWMSGSTPATESTMTKAEPSTNLGGSFSVDRTKIQVSPTSQPIQAYHEHPPSTMRMESRFNAHNQLLEAFPADIAEAIRYGREVEPRAHNDVTVVLSAIAGLDNLSKTMPENKLSDLVTRWKTCLDGICKELGVFAVETAGTAHMAVTNIENFHQDNHASLAAKFATKATLRATRIPVNEDDSSSGFLELCIGLHSGPVVSHVIGDNNPRFALIGDTINVAGHLQVSCPPGKIQCSDNAYFLLSGSVHDHASFDAMPRGIMPVKGQGDVMVYWIEPNLDQTETLNPGFAAAFFNM